MSKYFKSVLTAAGLFLCVLGWAQGTKSKVSGTVKDQGGEPLPGVLVLEAGTSNGATTDLDGKYIISVPPTASLEFSCMGYLSQSVAVAKRAVVDITLQEDNFLIEETVVVGYGTQRKIDLTGAVE